jgi:NADPH:quinone reductase-like Zn-dependent oxidoreductase
MKIAILGPGKVAHALGAGWKKAGLDPANAVTETGDLAYPNSSLAERLQQAVPAAHVVKSLNTAAIEVLILVGSTAAELLHVTGVSATDTVLLHGAAGAVGISALQQARLTGARVIGTASERNFGLVRRFGGEPVTYGAGLEQPVRELAPDGVTVAIDAIGTDEPVDVSLALVKDRSRVVTTAAFARAEAGGFQFVGARNPAAFGLLMGDHPAGKVALVRGEETIAGR